MKITASAVSLNGDDVAASVRFLSAQFGFSGTARDWREVHAPDEPDADWYLAGNPPQLMVGFPNGSAHLAQPVGQWQGVAELHYQPKRATEISISDGQHLRDVRDDLLRRRRATFRYCASCLRLTPPELRLDNVCMDCAAADGTVF